MDEFDLKFGEEMNIPLRRTLGNTKLKTRQDVRRFRKFLKRTYNIASTSLIEIEPDALREYLLDYLTSIRTRKGSKYDPETLRSYYLSIQRFLKDSNYPYCLRNSPQFARCRDLIIQMRKQKSQIKEYDPSSRTDPIIIETIADKPIDRNPSPDIIPLSSCFDHLPSSSLPPRKRQQMKYFLESNPTCNLYFFRETFPQSSPGMILSLEASGLLMKYLSASRTSISYLEQLLDQSSACGNKQRTMLTTLCHQWTGDIRIIHANLRSEISSFLPHILLINILSSKKNM